MNETLHNRTENKVQLVHGGSEYFRLLKQLINNAQNSIYIQTYIFEEDQTGTQIADSLKAASQRKVNVFLLVDGFASSSLSAPFIENLTESGIHFRMFEPLWKSKYFYLGRRLHHKVVAIDSKHALVSGINISDRYNDMPHQQAWLDWAVYATGDVAIWLTEICQQRIKPGSLKLLMGRRNNFGEKFRHNNVTVKINDWVRGKKEITASYLAMFQHAKSNINIMSAYFLPNDQFRKALSKAVKRGVRVKLILAGPSDIALAKYAERYLYRWLIRNGIEIFEYQKSVLHGKMAVYDNTWATVGSYNINTISAYASVELNLAVNDSVFAHQVNKALEYIMSNDCKPITANQILQYPKINRMLQWCSYMAYQAVFFIFTFYFKQRE